MLISTRSVLIFGHVQQRADLSGVGQLDDDHPAVVRIGVDRFGLAP